MNPLFKPLLDLAVAELGTREGPINNVGARIVEYQAATWLAPGAWPWCAAFTAWLMRGWLSHEEVRQALSLGSMSNAEHWRCRDASAFGWVAWARQRQVTLLDEQALARAGDFVVFDFSHIGLVMEDQSAPGRSIQTIEGNTNLRGTRDSPQGDGVWRKTRPPELVQCYLRVLS